MIHIFSDLHIGNRYCQLHKIEPVVDEAKHIISLGDDLDLDYFTIWQIMANKDNRRVILKILKKLVFKVPGNHDNEFIKLIGAREINIAESGSCFPVTEDKMWLMAHGHEYGYYSWLFRLLDKAHSSAMVRVLSRIIVGSHVLDYMSREANRDAFLMRENLLKDAMDLGADYVLYGHTHVPELREVGHITFVNPGSGLKRFSYATYNEGNKSFRLHGDL